MRIRQRAGSRRRQILQALNENGPLSVSTLAAVVRPRMELKSMRKAVRRLRDKGVLSVHFESMPYSGGHFYRISHDRAAREQIGKWLGISGEELRQPKFFSRELQHTTKCALWAAALRDQYPEAELVRDVEVIRRKIFMRHRFLQDLDRDSVPDIVLNFRGEMVRDTVSVGVEIERTRKSDKRLVSKLSKLVNQSVLDGVIYVCEAGGIRDAIAAVLDREKILRSPRIGHYGLAFVMFSDSAAISDVCSCILYNIEGKSVLLSDWLSALREISADFRRGTHFFGDEFAEPRGSANFLSSD